MAHNVSIKSINPFSAQGIVVQKVLFKISYTWFLILSLWKFHDLTEWFYFNFFILVVLVNVFFFFWVLINFQDSWKIGSWKGFWGNLVHYLRGWPLPLFHWYLKPGNKYYFLDYSSYWWNEEIKWEERKANGICKGRH